MITVKNMKKLFLSLKLPVRSSPLPCGPVASPTRPSFLPISEPIPVPTQRDAFQRMYSQSEKKEEPPSPTKVSCERLRKSYIEMRCWKKVLLFEIWNRICVAAVSTCIQITLITLRIVNHFFSFRLTAVFRGRRLSA